MKFHTLLLLFALALTYPHITAQAVVRGPEGLFSEPRFDVQGGFHFGVYDGNQTFKYPLAFGTSWLVNYYPDRDHSWYLGAELGGFYVSAMEDDAKWGRDYKTIYADIFPYFGYEFQFGQATSDLFTMRVSLGLPYVSPIQDTSEGPGYEEPEGSLGYGIMTSIDLPNRLALFTSIFRMNSDLDGFGHDLNGEIIAGNEHQVAYIYKIGLAWNFIPMVK